MVLAAELQAYRFVVDIQSHYFVQRLSNGSCQSKERWMKQRELGKGAAGEVWEIKEDAGAERVRAVKIVAGPGRLSDTEIQSLVILNQYERHFTRFFGWWEDAKSLYIIMEYMPGDTLGNLIKSNPEKPYLSESEAKQIAKKLLQGVAIMHSRNIAHRDLKPSNILLGDQGKFDVRIADLGISKALGATQARTNAGTQGYMAPEVFSVDGYGIAADIWSLGCVINATMTGQSPYPTFDTLPSASGGPVTFPSARLEYNGVSKLGIEFVKYLVTVDVKTRPTAAKALKHRWFISV